MGGRVQNKLSWGGAGDEWAPTEVFLSLDSCGEHLTIGSRARIQEWQKGRNRMLQCSGHVVRMGGKGEGGSAASAAPADECAGSCALLLLLLLVTAPSSSRTPPPSSHATIPWHSPVIRRRRRRSSSSSSSSSCSAHIHARDSESRRSPKVLIFRTGFQLFFRRFQFNFSSESQQHRHRRRSY